MAAIVIATAAAVRFDAFERFAAFTRVFEHEQVDDVAMAVPALLLAVALVLARRERRLREYLRQSEVRERAAYVEARIDAVTGLANRLAFAEALDGAEAGGAPFCLLVMDLDGFKSLNDRLGHAAGDEALRHVGARLRDIAQGVGTSCVGRIGGDEFGMIVRDMCDPCEVAARIVAELGRPFACENVSVQLSVSLGSAKSSDHAGGSTDLLRRADAAMYRAKRDGGARWCDGAPTHAQDETALARRERAHG